MTGFATATGAEATWSWSWEMRSVNGKGLNLRIRVPDWVTGLEAALRARLQAAVARGNVSVSLSLSREAGTDGIDRAAVMRALDQIATVEDIAAAAGRTLAPMKASEVLAMRAPPAALDANATEALRDAVLAQFDAEVLPGFIDSRAAEGAALDATLTARVDEIAALVARAGDAAADRRARQGDGLRAAVARLTAEVDVDPDRLAQELALIAVKQDITEELDRLDAHVAAARELVALDAAKGRKLDFLMQEFNREANTLCAKSQDSALTAIGLDLKTVIDQLREQVQNVE